ncbi:BED-type domain-containing protein [Citrus sinensis]|nr:BED-type domain-containing protein [Citrus sinensis]
MENEQRVDLDVSKTDESVGVRVGMDMAIENNDTATELEPDSTTVEQGSGSGSGSGSGRGRRGRDGTTVLSNYSTEPKWDMATMRVFIARMIVMHELPLSFVESIGFYELLKLLQPSIETISINTIKAEILKLYNIEKTKAMSVLEACDSRIAVTTDMWTASNQKKRYMVVTTYYIDNSWVLRSRIMRFIYVPAPHSGEVMCNELYECLMEWNVDRKLSTVTVDNCSANESMIDLLLGKFSTSSMIIDVFVRLKERDRNYTSLPSELEWNFSKLMYPRHKILLINFLFPKIYGERAESEIERVRKLFVDLVHEYEVKYSSNANWEVNGSASSEGVAADDSIMVDLDLDEMADEWESFRNQNSQNNHFKTKFEFYLEESTLPSTSQFDILSLWKNNQGKYPILAKIARDFLAIPVSTVASKSAFSTGDGIPEEAILSAEQLIDESLMRVSLKLVGHRAKYGLDGYLDDVGGGQLYSVDLIFLFL